MRASTCKICKGNFYLDNGGYVYDFICPDCKRDEINREKQYEQNIRLKKQIEANKDYNNYINKQEENKKEIASKIFKLASDNSADDKQINKLITLIINQHEDDIASIYHQINLLGSPYSESIKKILYERIHNRIEEEEGHDINYEEKALNYFSKNYPNYKYEIFLEFLPNKNTFFSLVKKRFELKENEINDLKKRLSMKLEERKQVKEIIGEPNILTEIQNYENELSDNFTTIKKYEKNIKIINFIFGSNNSNNLFPIIIWVLAILLFLTFKYFNLKIIENWKVIATTICTGYILAFIFQSINSKNEKNKTQTEKNISELKEKIELKQNNLKRNISARKNKINEKISEEISTIEIIIKTEESELDNLKILNKSALENS